MTSNPVDIVISHGFVVTMNARREVFADGAVAIRGGKIVAVGKSGEISTQFAPARTIDAGGGVVHPGFIDTHVHFMNPARGAFSDTLDISVSLDINKRWWNTVEDEDEYAAALLTCTEMLGNGTTCFLEAGTLQHPDAAVEAATRLGIRGYIGDPFLWDMPLAPDAHGMSRCPRDLRRSLDLLGGQLRRNKDDDTLIKGCVVLFGLGSASDELTKAAKELADRHGVIFTQHQSFGPSDAGGDERRFGKRALLHQAEMGILDRNCTFSHMNDLESGEVDAVARSGMSVAWCPSAAMTIGTGATISGSHLDLLKRGTGISLGSDGPNSSCRYDVGLQGLLALVSAREKTKSRAAMSLEDVLEMATINGAKAVGAEAAIGSLEPGKRADIVMRSTDIPEAQPGFDPLQAMIYSCGSKSVSTVLVDGKVVWSGGRPKNVEPAEVYQRARDAATRMWRKLELKPQHRWPVVY